MRLPPAARSLCDKAVKEYMLLPRMERFFSLVLKRRLMKNTFFPAGLVLLLVACNQGDQQSGNTKVSDTSTHSAHNSDTRGNGTGQGGSSGDMAGQSMMSMMERNMDQMKDVKSLGTTDKDFASMMKIHHTGAVEMAQLQLSGGTDQQLKDMAQNIIREQQQEVREFDAFLADTDQNNTAGKSSPFYDRVIKEMKNMNMGDMDHSGSIDQQFVKLMIPHHQGGIAMANLYLKTGAQEEKLKTIANSIRVGQQKEIQQLQAWLASHK
jgi:uncharacterized protein (DUF305 family)